ncbi:hypothetical protein Hanom_Chr04g00287651 [Helianthus anomalus]
METSPCRFLNPLSTFISMPSSHPMIILVRVCRLSNSPIPNGSFCKTEYPLCQNGVTF